jgi:hypothetical protein
MGSGRNEKLPPRRFSTVGIVREFRRSPTQPPHKHHQHGVPFAPLRRGIYGYSRSDEPIPKGSGESDYAGFYINR